MLLDNLNFKTLMKDKVRINNNFDTLAPLSENHPNRKVLSFINNSKFLDILYSNRDISCLICTEEIYEILKEEYLKSNKIGIIISENPKDTFFKIQNYLVKETEFYFKSFSNIISDKAKIHLTTVIEDKNIIIEDGVEIGANTIIHSNTIIKKNCKIGSNCIIGGESFSFNTFNKIYAGGRVILEENVELLGNNSIERGIYRDTIIKENTKISYGSVIEHDVEIGKNSLICANVTITEDKNVIIENGVEIGANTIIYSNTVIKKICKIGANCIIGGESFSFNNFNKIYAGGRVILEENVELLGNNSIERGIYRDTVIKENTKISYGSVIEHDVEIGKNTLICANVTITGRVKAGDNCYFGPGSVIRNGLEIESNGRANMGAIVTKNIKESEHVSGNFAVEHKKYLEFIKKIGD